MSTRSLTVMYDTPSKWETEGDEIAVLYRQMDGYPEGHGYELSNFLKDIVIVNGIPVGETRKIANGGGCLAAQIVVHFKENVGGFYLHPAGTRDCDAEYIYYVRPQRDGSISLTYDEVSGKKGIVLLC